MACQVRLALSAWWNSDLRRVDETFKADFGFNATNSEGYIVDLLCPETDDLQMMKSATDLEAVQMAGAEPIHLSTAEAAHSGCSKAAKLRFPVDHMARKEFMHWCKEQWKMYKASHNGLP
jgi:hypothetical protein